MKGEEIKKLIEQAAKSKGLLKKTGTTCLIIPATEDWNARLANFSVYNHLFVDNNLNNYKQTEVMQYLPVRKICLSNLHCIVFPNKFAKLGKIMVNWSPDGDVWRENFEYYFKNTEELALYLDKVLVGFAEKENSFGEAIFIRETGRVC